MTESKPTSKNLAQSAIIDQFAELPWWMLFVLFAGSVLVYLFFTDKYYTDAFKQIIQGIGLTVQITLSAYSVAICLGLVTALGQLSKNIIIRNIATLYVQVIRGVPMLVQVFYVGFVLAPMLNNWLNEIGARIGWGFLAEYAMPLNIRAVMALALGYGAFSSEIFRAGIQSIEKGQIEASQSLGLRPFQTLRLVILPQAFRRILPPLGNDFIAMLKESSLASAVGANEITQKGKLYTATSFRYAETYNTVAFMYLSMTLILSMGVRWLERRMKVESR